LERGRLMKLRTIGVSLFLLLLALVPRVLGLNVFLTNDERRWVDRSIMFLQALLDGNLGGTASGHPGVTTMWTAAIALTTQYASKARLQGMPISVIGLREFLRRVPVRPVLAPDVLAAVRLPTVVLVSLAVVGIYLLLRRLFDDKIALLSAALVALDPFYLAYSRLLHHDALATTFMILSLLGLMVYLERERSGGYLLLSGLMAGLAFLSKASSLFLIPFMVWPILLSNWPRGQGTGGAAQREDALLHGAKTYLAWCALSLLTVIVFWPAMWVDPMRPVGLVLGQVTGKVQGMGEGEDSFLTGISLLDAQVLTYPITLLFRVTPLALVGVAAAVWFLGRDHSPSRLPKSDQRTRSMIILLAYILGFIVFMSLARVKSGRYILPVSPAVQIVAAVGLWRLGESVAKVVRAPRTRLTTSRLGTMGLGLTILLQAGLSLPHHPYYLAYYSPLLGGGVVAPRLMPIGWGEGLDQAAHYLNQKENATSLKAAMWDSDVRFASFFRGEIRKLNEECNGNSLPWEDIDYVVFYVSNRGTGVPFGLSTARYFNSLEPEHVVRMKGMDYVWIYAAPGPEIPNTFVPAQYDLKVKFGSSSLLLGYALEKNQLKAGQTTKVTLYWQCQKPSEADLKPVLTLVGGEGEVWGREMEAEDWEDPWGRGLVIRDELKLEVEPATPAGTYQLLLSLYDEEGNRLPTSEGEEVPLGLMMVTGENPTLEELEIAYPQRADLGSGVRFLGYNLSATRFQPGGTLRLVLYWQALTEIGQDYTVFTHLIDHDGVVWGQKDSWPVDGSYPTGQWAQGDVIEDPYEIGISPETPSGDYRLEVGMYLLETGERLPVTDEAGSPLGNRILLSSTVQVGRRE
jgi:4-amino-4-deoxy-L-arabinose transferase-like glycosyltransferase